MRRWFTLFAVPATLALGVFANSASAQITLLDATTNNGSFEDPTDADSSGASANLDATDANGGIRFANTGGGTITVPGWTLDQTGTGFGGLNFSSSTQADDGATSIVKNDAGAIVGTTDPIPFDLADGSLFTLSGAFEWRQGAGGTGGQYSLSLLFDDGTVLNAALNATFDDGPNLGTGTLEYSEQVSIDLEYVGTDATTVQVQFEIDGSTSGASNTQTLADDFVLIQDQSPFIPGDVDGDLAVDNADGLIIFNNFNTVQTERDAGDLVANEFVDLGDFLQWKLSVPLDAPSVASAAIAVPEPSSALLIAVAMLGLRGRPAKRA